MSNIYRATAAEAFENARGNVFRRYPSPNHDAIRLYPLTNPSVSPGFKIAASDTIFAVGSCFARNVEGALQKAGMEVVSRDLDLGKIGESAGAVGNFFNKYTVHSIYNDLKWALERETFPEDNAIIPLDDGGCCDLQLGIMKFDYALSEVLEFRHKYLDTLARVAEVDVIVITLGYVETWFDTELGIYLNATPPQKLCKKFPNRFEFRVLGFQDVIDGLNSIHELLTKHRKKPLKMLLTVSPVPLLSTFRDIDVLVANTYSKSVQRAAVETFAIDKDGIDYFPSYEFVTLTNPTIAWARNDFRHVSPDLVERIMSNILVNYVEDYGQELGQYAGIPMTSSGIRATARLLERLQEQDALSELAVENSAAMESSVSSLFMLATQFEKANKYEDAQRVLEKLVDIAPERPVPLQRLIGLTHKHLDDKEPLFGLLELHQARFPTRKGFRKSVSNRMTNK